MPTPDQREVIVSISYKETPPEEDKNNPYYLSHDNGEVVNAQGLVGQAIITQER